MLTFPFSFFFLLSFSNLLFCGQMSVPGLYDTCSLYRAVPGKSIDDFEPYLANNKQTGRVRGVPDNNLLRSFVADKEKASNVAKIKVVVCCFYFILFFPRVSSPTKYFSL